MKKTTTRVKPLIPAFIKNSFYRTNSIMNTMIKFKLSLVIAFVFAIQNISFSQTNIDFETGNLNGWTGHIGANFNSSVSFTSCSTAVNPLLNGVNLSMIPKSYFSMMTPAGANDLYGNFSMTSPLGGSNVIRLGNENTNVNEGGDCSTPKNCLGIGPGYCSTICGTPVGSGYIQGPAEAVTQTFAVTSANALLTYAWAAVLNDGGHPVNNEPYFEVKIYNQSGVEQTCFTNRVIQRTGVTTPGWTKSATQNCWYGSAPSRDVYYKGWTTVNVLLSNYIGQNITVRFAVAGCTEGGHFGYAYFDSKTGPADITPSNATPCGSQTLTLTAPSGVAGPYSWSGPGIVSGASTGTVTVNAGGTYTLSVGTGTCVATMTSTVTYSGGPSVTASAGSPTICANQSVVLTAGGATTYTWSANAGSATTSTVSVNPGSTTTYTVTGNTGGCTGTQTVTVNVTPTPTLTVNSPTICSGQSTVLTATTATSYSWNTGATTNTISVNPGSTTVYTVTGTNGSCSTAMTATVTVNTTPTVNISGTNTVCSGNPVILTGATASNYTWSTSATTSTISVIPPVGNTTYTLTGANGPCTATASITLTVTATPTLNITGTNNICSGQSTVLTGATASNYTWNPGGINTSTISVNPGSTATYTLTGANGNCTATNTVQVTVNTTPTVNISGTTTVCSGNPVVLTGATASNYTWSTSATTNTISVTPPAGTTTYTLTGANGPCTATASITLTVTPTPTLNVNNASICSGQSAVLTATTATSYSWSTGATTSTISVNPSSTTVYTVTGDNGNGCTAVKTATVTVTATPTLNISGASPICSGTTLILTGGTATNYTWLPGGLNTSTISITPPAGTNTYTLQGANGTCTASTTVFVDVSPTPTINITGAAPLCSGQSLVLTGSGAGTFTWSANAGSANTSTVSVNPSSTTVYTLTGTSGTCTSSATTTVTVNTTPTLTLASNTYTICNGNSTPITASGATTYTWTTGSGLSCTVCPTPTASPGSTTVYTVSGTTGGCVSAPATVTVNVNALPTLTLTPASSSICSSASTTITAGGANSYTWSPAGSLSSGTGSPVTATPTASTNYTVTATDNNGCQNSNTVNITVAPTPTMSINAVPGAVCAGQSVVLNGGTATTYTWSSNAGSANSATVSVTPSATDTYTLTGSIGSCTASTTVTVPVNPLPVIGSASITAAPCGQNTGCIDSVAVSGGAPTYTYSWNGGSGSTSPQYCNQPAGTYVLIVTDANGCQATQNFSIPNLNGPSAPTVAASATVACLGDTLVLTVTSPQTGVTYTWTDITGTNTGTTYTISNIGPGGSYNISVTATDTNGCVSAGTPVTINVNNLPGTTVSGVQHFCKNDNTVLNASPTGAGYTYQWTQNGTPISGATASSYSATAAGNYGVVITDNGTGCKAASLGNYVITVDSLPAIDTSNMVITASGCNQSTGSVTSVSVTPNATNNSYTWTDSGGNTVGTGINLGNVPAGTYCLLVTDSNNCKTTICGVNVNNAGAPNISIAASANNICSGTTTTLTASGAPSYTWSPGGATTNTISVTPGATATYTVTGDSLGCTTQQQVTINVTATPSVTASSSQSSICSSQSATLTASGATTYSWLPSGSGGSIVVNPSTNTTYTVIGMNGNCSDSSIVNLNVTPTPTLNITSAPPAICAGQTATLTATGANSYTWQPTGANTGTITDNPSTTTVYTVTGDSAGCTGAPQTVTVTVNQLPVLTTTGIQSACAGGTINAINYTLGGVTVNWTNTNGNVGIPVSGSGDINTYTAPNVTTTETGVLTATPVDNGTGCQGAAQTYTVIINPLPQATGGTPDSALCGAANGGVTGVNVTGGTPSYSYQWYNSGGIMVNDTNATLNNVPAGTYSVMITDANGCQAPAGATTFTVGGSAAISTTITPPLTQGQGPLTVVFTSNTTGATVYNWNMGNGQTDTSATPAGATYTAPGTYTVILISSNGGCLSIDTALVIIDAAIGIEVPNIYSPNGDGINDTWHINSSGYCDLHCEIYNRWGQLVYQLLGVNDEWNGIMNNGNPASEGTYYYILEAKSCVDGKPYKVSGYITLVK